MVNITDKDNKKLLDAQKGTLQKIAHIITSEKREDKRRQDRIDIIQYYSFRHREITGNVASVEDIVTLFDVTEQEAEDGLRAVIKDTETYQLMIEKRDHYYLKAPWEDKFTEVSVEQCCRAERSEGFYNKSNSLTRPATASFTASNGIRGFISYGKPADKSKLE